MIQACINQENGGFITIGIAYMHTEWKLSACVPEEEEIYLVCRSFQRAIP